MTGSAIAVGEAPEAASPASEIRGGRRPPEALLHAPPLRAILQLAAPTTGVMAIAATSNILYTYYVSRLGADAIAAVSLVFPISMMAMTAMAGGIGSGVSSAIARSLGAGTRSAAAAVAEHALLLSSACGIVFAVGMFFGAPTLFALMGGRGAIFDSAVIFARAVFAGSIIPFTATMFDSILRGEGNVRVPSVWATVSLVLQMALTPLFMFPFGFGLVGAPIAMITGQFLATIPRAAYVWGGKGHVHPARWPRQLSTTPVREILRVGIPASLSTTVNYVGLMVLTGVVARLGDAHLAAYGLGSRLDFLLLSFAFGFGAAVLTLVGLATGARRPDKVAAYVVRAGAAIVTVLTIPAALLWWNPNLWLRIFTDDADILAVGALYFRIIGPSYPFMGVAMVLAFAFQGMGRATAPLVWMVLRVGGVLAAAIVCTRHFGFGDAAVFTVVAAGNVISAAAMLAMFLIIRRRSSP